MKRLPVLFFISLFLFSCQKSHQVSIVGTWSEVAVYRDTNNGHPDWEPASRFPLRLSFNVDGEYNAFNDVPAGNGRYSFNYFTGELHVENLNPTATEVYSVSHLDDEYLVIDYSSNYKIKFIKL